METESPSPVRKRSRLIWWLIPVVIPAAALGYHAPAFWAHARDAAEKAGEPRPVKLAILYVVAWFVAAVILPLLIAFARRRRDGFLAILDETMTMALVAIALSGALALITAG